MVVLLHDMGAHPDWSEVIRPLRQALVAAGWAVFSPQLPLLAAGSSRGDYEAVQSLAVARIRLALSHVQAQDFARLAVVGYGTGASASLICFVDPATPKLFAFTAIGLHQADNSGDVPFLDVFGSLDESQIRTAVTERALAARRRTQSDYRRIEIVGADHRFTGNADELVKRVSGWLNSLI